MRPVLPLNVSNDRFRSRQSRRLGMDVEISKPVYGAMTSGSTRRSGSCTGRGLRSTPLTTLKMAVLAPIPSVSASNDETETQAEMPDDDDPLFGPIKRVFAGLLGDD